MGLTIGLDDVALKSLEKFHKEQGCRTKPNKLFKPQAKQKQ